jgi:hypothetical protein
LGNNFIQRRDVAAGAVGAGNEELARIGVELDIGVLLHRPCDRYLFVFVRSIPRTFGAEGVTALVAAGDAGGHGIRYSLEGARFGSESEVFQAAGRRRTVEVDLNVDDEVLRVLPNLVADVAARKSGGLTGNFRRILQAFRDCLAECFAEGARGVRGGHQDLSAGSDRGWHDREHGAM